MMIRNLLIVSGAGLVLAIAGIGGALALGGSDLSRNDWTWVFSEDNSNSIQITRGKAPSREANITRQIALGDVSRLAISLPGKVRYVQNGAPEGITLTGPKTLVDRVTFANGQLVLAAPSDSDRAYVSVGPDGIRGWSDDELLEITINTGALTGFDLQGNTDLVVHGYDKPALDLVLTGNADVEIQGRTAKLTVDASGNSSAELDDLLTTDATINVSGNAGVKTSANGVVAIDGSGNARVRLTRRPSELRQSLSGDAEVRQD